MQSLPSESWGSASAGSNTGSSRKGQTSLAIKVNDQYDRHTELHQLVQPLLGCTRAKAETEDLLYKERGLLTTRQTEWKRADAQAVSSHKQLLKVQPNFATKPFLLAARKRKLLAARARWSSDCAERDDLVRTMARMKEQIQNKESRIKELGEQEIQLAQLEKQIDQLDEELFGGPTPGWPSEDRAEQAVLVLKETIRFVTAEAEREARARQKLTRSLPCLEGMLGALKKALAITLDAGVPTDMKYTRQLFVNGTDLAVARQITPLVLSAKTQSGTGHTFFAEARGRQLLIRQLPTLTLMELNKVPGKSTKTGKDTYNERSMHASLETSYAQAQAQVAHVKKELTRSRQRTKFFTDRIKVLKDEQRDAQLALRAKRRQIVELVNSGRDRDGEAALAEQAHGVALEDLQGLDDDELTLGGDTVVEEEMYRAEQEALGLEPRSQADADLAEGESRSEGNEDPPLIRNPMLVALAERLQGSQRSGDDSCGILSPEQVALRSTRALRRIMKECIKHTNSLAIGTEIYNEELPTFWDMA